MYTFTTELAKRWVFASSQEVYLLNVDCKKNNMVGEGNQEAPV